MMSEKRFRNILESMIEGCQIVGYDWRYLYLNRSAVKQSQLTRDQLIGRTMMECYPGIEQSALFATLRQCMNERTSHQIISEFIYPNGTKGWFELNIQPAPDGIFILSSDITKHKQAEQALLERDMKLMTIFEILPVGISILDAKHKMSYSNPALQKMLDISEEGLIQGIYRNRKYLKADGTLMLPDEMASARAYKEKREIDDVETGVVKEDGNIIWTNVSAVPVDFPDWKVVMVTLDITERKKVAEIQSYLAAVVEYSNDAIISKDLTGTVTSWNTGAQRIFGYTADEMIGRSILRLIPPDHLQEEEQILNQIAQDKVVTNFETVRITKDGRRVDVSVTASPIKDMTGRVVGASKVARDITDSKQAEERFRLAIEAAPNAIIMVDQHGQIILVNSQTENFFGYDRAELIAENIDKLVPTRFRGNHANHRVGFFSQPKARSMGVGRDLYGLRKDGTEFPVEIGLNPIQTDEGSFVLAAIIDVTERKRQMEELKNANQSLERSNIELQRFAYVASHDLQTPLRSISGFVQLLQSQYAGQLDKQANDWIRRTVQSTEILQKSIQDLLSYSRVDMQAHPFTRIPFSEVINDAILLLETPIQDSGAEVMYDGLPTVMGDRSQLVQLMQNLIGNALKYRDDTAPRVHVAAVHNGNEWIISVRDNGIGIQPKNYEKIFEIFQRLHNHQEYPGSGIGLAICRRVVHRHGGKIWVESEPGHGSTFYFTIPERMTNPHE